MDAAAFEQLYEAFGEFHSFFAPLFGRRESRDHSQNYLRALLVQSQDRRNAENLSESVGVPARAMQRLLTAAPWDDDAVMGRLQEYLAPRLGHPEAVWVLDGSDFPKQGRKSAGVARQYCGRLGKVANCQAGMFLAYVSPLGRALVDQRLYLPESWTSDDARCAAAGVPEDQRRYRSKTELALELLQQALERGHLRAGSFNCWVEGRLESVPPKVSSPPFPRGQATWPRAAAMFLTPLIRNLPITKFPSAASSCGADPVRTWLWSSPKTTSLTQCSPFSIPQCPRHISSNRAASARSTGRLVMA